MELTENQKETLVRFRAYYSRVLSEDPQDGSRFDCAILDLLTDDNVEKQVNNNL